MYESSSEEDDSHSHASRFDLSYLQLGDEPIEGHLQALLLERNNKCPPQHTKALYLHQNQLTSIPEAVACFNNLRILDISSNHVTELSSAIISLTNLRSLLAKNNSLGDHSLPKDFGILKRLEELNLSGNNFTTIVPQIMELENLKGLFLGSNQLNEVPTGICRLVKLQVLYLGGNNLQELPAEVGLLQSLQALILCENKLESLPSTITHLRRLRSLSLHKNSLKTLPPDIVRLQGLSELSLRDNPLVVRFIRDMVYNPPSLLELAARTVKVRNINYKHEDLPQNLHEYLRTAHRCVNPKCKGVYFNARVEHIKFVDFCGKYKIPLLQYLCSPKCTTIPAFYTSSESESEEDGDIPVSALRKVLLG